MDGDSENDDPWDFGDDGEYPVLRADWNDADTTATWQEFGYQTRSPLALTVTRDSDPQASVSWPDITETGWTGSPQASYVLYRDGAALTGYDGQSLTHTDTGLTAGQHYVYQVALLLDGVEFRRSREVSTEAASMTTNPSPLTERTLHGARLTVDLARTEYVSELLPDHFALSPATAGLSVASVDRVNNTRAILTLAFSGNFGSELELSVMVASAATIEGETLTTDSVTVTPAPASDQVTGVNATGGSASLDVTWDPAANADGYVVQWRLEGEPLYENSVSVPGGLTTRTTLGDLLHETTYQVQVYATSHFASDGPPSAMVTATTLIFMVPPPPPPPADAIVWHTVPCPLSEANLDGATITLALLERAHLVWQSNLNASHFTASGVPGVSVTGVASLSDQQVALVLAYDDTDFDEDATLLIVIDDSALYFGGPISAETTVQAVVETSPGQVAGVRVTPGPRRITVNWDALPGAHGYRVQWQRQAQDWQTDWLEVGGRQRTLQGLHAGTDYTVRVVAIRDKAPYGEPSAAVATATPAFRAAITATEPSPLTEYNLNEATVTIDLEGAEWALQLHGPRLTLDRNLIRPRGLPVWVEYVERVSASRLKVTLAYRGGDIDKDAEGNDPTLTLVLDKATNGWAGAEVTVTVEATDEADTAQEQTTVVTATGGDKEIEVWWNPVDGATGYNLEWKSGSQDYDANRRVITPATRHIIRKGLESGTEYFVRVAAFIPRIGYGPWSTEATATTESATEQTSQSQMQQQQQPRQTARVIVRPVRVTLPEGWTGSYGLSLNTRPDGDVTITMFSDNPDVKPYPNPSVFTPENWDTIQLIGVPAAEDDDAVNGTATISRTASGGNYDGVTVSSVTVTVTDEDTAGVTVSKTSLNLWEGESATYRVSLDTQPLHDVNIFVNSHGTGVTAEPEQLTFTPYNWRNAQTVTVRTARDGAGGEAFITHALLVTSGSGYNGVQVPNVVVTVTDGATEREILRDFYNATSGPDWTNNDGWLSSQPLGEWHGVTTNAQGEVTTIVLDGNSLRGSLPPGLGNLQSLTRLAMNRNSLTGAIPSELGNLSNLRIIGLARNQLSGALPTSLGNLSGLTKVSLHDNTGLSGALPAGIGEMTGLTRLALSRTGLSGQLPQGLVNSAIQYLHFDDTSLCAPSNTEFQEWLDGVPDKSGATCGS